MGKTTTVNGKWKTVLLKHYKLNYTKYELFTKNNVKKAEKTASRIMNL
jgi:hypothetical protein